MTVPLTQTIKHKALGEILQAGVKLRIQIQNLYDDSAAGDTRIRRYTNLQRDITRTVQTWNTYRTLSGLQCRQHCHHGRRSR